MKETTRKYILLSLLIFVMVGFIVATVLANKQNQIFETEDFLYQQTIQLYQAGNYTEAQSLIADLTIENGDSEMVNYLAGLIAANLGEYSAAAIYMQKTLDINPHNVEVPMFMLQFAEVLFSAERYADAKVVLERCKEWNWQPQDYPGYQEQVQGMLAQIENIEQGR
ncbi:tetratricopeptide repeat protein [Metasolibacillus fluoroglycofenilyticus]|uniref:tetratricopeptide repeat protein n=1 Tax=Metasolibacillus fluoroglycofenilyticus TaxID=1239396 RepID=UPI000D38900D|nr:tetratricopeptide repeat protein [Metasolibacillus fluoroglycofenilyticus]